jgi:hypothetical protein
MLAKSEIVKTLVVAVVIGLVVFVGAAILQVAPPLLYMVPIGLAAIWALVRGVQAARKNRSTTDPV